MARQLQLSLDGKYSSFPTLSIRRYLQKLGRRAYRPRRCPKWSQTDMKKRLDCCRFHEHFTVEVWNSIIFSDEAYIEFNLNDNPQYVRRSKFDAITTKHCGAQSQSMAHQVCLYREVQ